MSVNKVILVGNLGRDPESATTESGRVRTRFSVATNRRYKDTAGELHEEVTWHNVVAWGPLGETVAQHLTKGRQVYVEGRIRNYEYADAEGSRRFGTEVVAETIRFLGKKNGNGENAGQPASEAEGEIPF